MEHVHSIILIKRGDKYLNYFDERWGMYLFPNIKGVYLLSPIKKPEEAGL